VFVYRPSLLRWTWPCLCIVNDPRAEHVVGPMDPRLSEVGRVHAKAPHFATTVRAAAEVLIASGLEASRIGQACAVMRRASDWQAGVAVLAVVASACDRGKVPARNVERLLSVAVTGAAMQRGWLGGLDVYHRARDGESAVLRAAAATTYVRGRMANTVRQNWRAALCFAVSAVDARSVKDSQAAMVAGMRACYQHGMYHMVFSMFHSWPPVIAPPTPVATVLALRVLCQHRQSGWVDGIEVYRRLLASHPRGLIPPTAGAVLCTALAGHKQWDICLRLAAGAPWHSTAIDPVGPARDTYWSVAALALQAAGRNADTAAVAGYALHHVPDTEASPEAALRLAVAGSRALLSLGGHAEQAWADFERTVAIFAANDATMHHAASSSGLLPSSTGHRHPPSSSSLRAGFAYARLDDVVINVLNCLRDTRRSSMWECALKALGFACELHRHLPGHEAFGSRAATLSAHSLRFVDDRMLITAVRVCALLDWHAQHRLIDLARDHCRQSTLQAVAPVVIRSLRYGGPCDWEAGLALAARASDAPVALWRSALGKAQGLGDDSDTSSSNVGADVAAAAKHGDVQAVKDAYRTAMATAGGAAPTTANRAWEDVMLLAAANAGDWRRAAFVLTRATGRLTTAQVDSIVAKFADNSDVCERLFRDDVRRLAHAGDFGAAAEAVAHVMLTAGRWAEAVDLLAQYVAASAQMPSSYTHSTHAGRFAVAVVRQVGRPVPAEVCRDVFQVASRRGWLSSSDALAILEAL
jgi:hypothetical protein